MGQRAHCIVVTGFDGAGLATCLPVGPAAGEGVLEEGELVRIVTHVIDEAGEQGGLDVGAAYTGGAEDGGAAVVPAHPRHQVLSAVDGFGQAGEAGAVAEEVGAHGQHDVDRRILGAGLEQQVDEGGGRGFVGGRNVVKLAVAEEFFELVHDHQELGAFGQARLLPGFDQAPATHGKGGLDEFGEREGAVVQLAVQGARGGEGLGECPQGVAARSAAGDAPGAAGTGEEAPVQGRAQAAIDEGRLAAAGAADDGQEAPAGESVHHGVHLGFTAEEQVLLVFAEGADAGVGAGRQIAHGVSDRPRAA